MGKPVVNHAIPPIIQLKVFIKFAATGSFLLSVADFFGISKTSAERIVSNVSLAISELHKEFIKFPSENQDILQNKVSNFNLSGFIHVIGAIDCIHVRIQSYGGDDGELFRNRKGFFSINVQAVVNSSLQILDWVAYWPGATHDATIFDNSRLKSRFKSGEFGNGVLLGDSGYPSLPFLLTPLQNPQTPSEILYNEAQIRTRSMVERCFGLLGRMFPVLTLGSRFRSPQKTLQVITACAVLYNLSRETIAVTHDDIDKYNNVDRDLHENLVQNERQYTGCNQPKTERF
ncbi:putative nuclease HARBI1 [Prorops nasuta]|uniref:putative nuclease HARBI1 n=1 Tax=Prorops nasuta TaxID=863751 RepID=UPI0034CE98A9